MSKLGMELSKVLFREEPALLVADLPASARAAAEVSNLLGCILATVLTKQGNDAYLEACKAAMMRMNESAITTSTKAQSIAPNITTQ